MKAILLFLFSAPLLVAAQGIRFENTGWTALLAKAKAEKKLIFVDAFATWCGPCKQMTSKVFPQKSVGDFYNRNFINAKIDMEKGEGVSLATKYNVTAYPTYLFVNGDGKIVHKAIGYIEATPFIETGMNALDPSKQYYTLKEKYKKGQLNAEQFVNLMKQASELEDEDGPLMIKDYFKTQNNWLTKDNIEILLQFTDSPESEYFRFLAKNELKITELVGKEKIRTGLDNIVFSYAVKNINTKKLSTTSMIDFIDGEVLKVETIIKPFRPGRAKLLSYYYGVIAAEKAEEDLQLEKYMIQYIEEGKHEFTWQQLNEQAWHFFEHIKTPASLRYALNWGLQSITLDSNFYNNDTVANLYNKLGDKKNAKLYAQRAIKLGKDIGEDVSETEALLKTL